VPRAFLTRVGLGTRLTDRFAVVTDAAQINAPETERNTNGRDSKVLASKSERSRDRLLALKFLGHWAATFINPCTSRLKTTAAATMSTSAASATAIFTAHGTYALVEAASASSGRRALRQPCAICRPFGAVAGSQSDGRVARRAQAAAGSAAWSLLPRRGKRRVLARAFVGEPLYPCGRVVGPFLHLDAPCRRLRTQKIGLALRWCETARNGRPRSRH
jgi:hypothetical protein